MNITVYLTESHFDKNVNIVREFICATLQTIDPPPFTSKECCDRSSNHYFAHFDSQRMSALSGNLLRVSSNN